MPSAADSHSDHALVNATMPFGQALDVSTGSSCLTPSWSICGNGYASPRSYDLIAIVSAAVCASFCGAIIRNFLS